MYNIICSIFVFGVLIYGFIKLLDLSFIEYLRWKDEEERGL